ncbi:hypothetical protein [Succinivibrio sp.]|uniref:hypothetical protein n=1 Tax=Succinivibrio sp. TaxID=2053619 RepID=UPI0025EF9F65|nr:hypothetical protein [Succinivibrio sp.]MBQ9220031.1 hypothetical protein [Succinivibrio sp.]
MRFSTFLDTVSNTVCVLRPDGRDYNVIFDRSKNLNLEFAETHKERFIKYICRVDAYGILCYDVELYPAGAPEGDVQFEEYGKKEILLW